MIEFSHQKNNLIHFVGNSENNPIKLLVILHHNRRSFQKLESSFDIVGELLVTKVVLVVTDFQVRVKIDLPILDWSSSSEFCWLELVDASSLED